MQGRMQGRMPEGVAPSPTPRVPPHSPCRAPYRAPAARRPRRAAIGLLIGQAIGRRLRLRESGGLAGQFAGRYPRVAPAATTTRAATMETATAPSQRPAASGTSSCESNGRRRPRACRAWRCRREPRRCARTTPLAIGPRDGGAATSVGPARRLRAHTHTTHTHGSALGARSAVHCSSAARVAQGVKAPRVAQSRVGDHWERAHS